MAESDQGKPLPEGVSAFTFGERLDNYLDQFGGKSDGTQERYRRRGEVYDLAHGAAVAEMLDEIHVMLRALLERRGSEPQPQDAEREFRDEAERWCIDCCSERARPGGRRCVPCATQYGEKQ